MESVCSQDRGVAAPGFIRSDDRILIRHCTRCYRAMGLAADEPWCLVCANPEFSLVDVTTLPLFGIELWDHDEDRFSAELAEECLACQCEYLTPIRFRYALRQIREHWVNWICVYRMELPQPVVQRELFGEGGA